MKKVILIGLFLTGGFGCLLAESREELMARMGFSKEEIAKDVARHEAMSEALATTGGKGDPKTARAALREANEVNELRASRAVRQEAESAAEEAQKRAALAKTREQEAEARAEVAVHETRRLWYNAGVSGQTYSDAVQGRDRFVKEAREAREAAKEEARKAERARATADRIIAKTKATEAKLEKERAARVVNR